MPDTSLLKPPAAAGSPVGLEVLRGLTSYPKTLSPWLFYDSEGSRLFEKITELPEYYLTRTEREILARHAAEIVAAAAEDRELIVIELGAGTGSKTGLLLQAVVALQGRVTYRPIDISESALEEGKSRLEAELSGVTVEPWVADYTVGLERIGAGLRQSGDAALTRRLVLYIGSSIGNFMPADALALLRGVRAQLLPGDSLLLGADRVKDPGLLLAAYDDAAGVTAEFNRNILMRINRELDANFSSGMFRHRARWNGRDSRIEMHLESLAAQRVSIAALDLRVAFAAGETIHTENSYKFTEERIVGLLKQAGFAVRRRWSDAGNWFAVHLATAR